MTQADAHASQVEPASETQPAPASPASGHWLRRLVFPILVLLAGAAVAALVLRAKPEEKRVERERVARTVSLVVLEKRPIVALIQSRGVVQAEREITLIPEVVGKVIHVSDSLVVGGKVKKGEVLLRIDGRNYQHQITQQSGQLRGAELQVELEKNQRELANYEAALLGDTDQRSPLALRESHLEAAKSAVTAQEGVVASAKLNLARTVIRAPFDASVVTDNVDIGQVVGLSSQLARLVATAELRVEVSVVVEDLDMFQFPRGDVPGAKAIVRQRLARGPSVEREGTVSRLVQELDQRTRRARVLVTIKDPFNPEKGLPLLPGAHVEVDIVGRELSPLTPIPRSAVYDGDSVWVADKQSNLKRYQIQIEWADQRNVYVRNEFLPAERLITTLLSTPVEGLPVRDEASLKKRNLPAAPSAEPSTKAPGG